MGDPGIAVVQLLSVHVVCAVVQSKSSKLKSVPLLLGTTLAVTSILTVTGAQRARASTLQDSEENAAPTTQTIFKHGQLQFDELISQAEETVPDTVEPPEGSTPAPPVVPGVPSIPSSPLPPVAPVEEPDEETEEAPLTDEQEPTGTEAETETEAVDTEAEDAETETEAIDSAEDEQVDADSDDSEETPVEAPSIGCLLYTSPSPRDLSTSRMPSSA